MSRRRRTLCSLQLADDETEHVPELTRLEEGVAGRAGPSVERAHRLGVCGEDLDQLAAGELPHRLRHTAERERPGNTLEIEPSLDQRRHPDRVHLGAFAGESRCAAYSRPFDTWERGCWGGSETRATCRSPKLLS